MNNKIMLFMTRNNEHRAEEIETLFSHYFIFVQIKFIFLKDNFKVIAKILEMFHWIIANFRKIKYYNLNKFVEYFTTDKFDCNHLSYFKSAKYQREINRDCISSLA